MTDEDYMRMALEEARLAAEEGEVPIGAVVVHGMSPVEGTGVVGRTDMACGAGPSASAKASEDAGQVGGAAGIGLARVRYEGGEVIARAHNRRETDKDPSAHAEFSAMCEAARMLDRWRLTGCTVYVTLEPCLMCAGLMVNGRIDRCVFGAPDPKGGALGTLFDVSHDERLNHEFEVTGGVLADECAATLREFFRARRAKNKAAAKAGSEGPKAEPEDPALQLRTNP